MLFAQPPSPPPPPEPPGLGSRADSEWVAARYPGAASIDLARVVSGLGIDSLKQGGIVSGHTVDERNDIDLLQKLCCR